jgi:hypothetical protein
LVLVWLCWIIRSISGRRLASTGLRGLWAGMLLLLLLIAKYSVFAKELLAKSMDGIGVKIDW